MRRFRTGTLFAGVAAAAAIGLSSPPAFAATWTVSGGPSFTATSTNLGSIDVSTGATFTCSSSTIKGSVTDGTGLAGDGIAIITSAAFGDSTNTCTGTFSSRGTFALHPGTTWSFNAASYDSASGTTSGAISGVDLDFNFSNLFGTCNAELTGSLGNVTYNNSTGQLVISQDSTPHLTYPKASGPGCAGIWRAGDQATFQATFLVSPRLQITSP
jgi:hypothetical protein